MGQCSVKRRTPEPEVGVQNLTPPFCVLEQDPKVLVIPRKRWLRPDITKKVLTGTLNLNTNKVRRATFKYNCVRTLSPIYVPYSLYLAHLFQISVLQGLF